MKQIAPNYSYNKTTGVITLTGVDIDRDQLLLIVNTTRNVIYYNFADSATTLQAFTKGENTSFTLASSVVSASSAHTNADALTIYYDDQTNTVTADIPPASATTISTFTSATSADVLTASAGRKGAVFYSSGSGSSFLTLGTSATSSSAYSLIVSQNDIVTITGYTGKVTGLTTDSAVLHITSFS